MDRHYDITVIGSGPAGLSAALYIKRAGLTCAVIGKDGGALEKAEKIENYFGTGAISGAELVKRGVEQAKELGADIFREEVFSLGWNGNYTVSCSKDNFISPAVIIATGSARKSVTIPGIKEFEGKGVSYCAVCDAFFYRGRAAAVLGQGEYALEEARVLLPVAGSVTLLTNGQSAPENLPDGLAVDTRPVSAVEGGETVERVVFADGETLPLDGVFVALGTAGSTDFARKLGAPLDGTHIRANADGSTAVPGLFAAGDCTGGLLQIAKAVSDGAQAAMSAVKFLRK